MKPRFRGLAFALAILATCASFAGCGSSGSDTRRIILLTNGDDQFWDAMRKGMEKAAEDFKLEAVNLRVVMDKNDGEIKGQIDKLKQYSNQTDIAAVAISVIDASNVALADAMRQLRSQGIKVLTIDSDIDRNQFRDARFAYLGTDNVVAGQELGKAAKALRPTGGKYATFVGHKSAANAVERIGGFAQAATGFEQLESLGDQMDLSVAQQNVRTALENHPSLNTLVGIWSYNAAAIVQVVSQRKLRDSTNRDQMTIVTFDSAPEALTAMGDGMIDAMVVQNPYQMGYLGTELMKAMIEGDNATIMRIFPEWTGEGDEFKTDNGDLYTTELRVVVADERSPLKPNVFRETTKFFYLKDFRNWLNERNLRGS